MLNKKAVCTLLCKRVRERPKNVVLVNSGIKSQINQTKLFDKRTHHFKLKRICLETRVCVTQSISTRCSNCHPLCWSSFTSKRNYSAHIIVRIELWSNNEWKCWKVCWFWGVFYCFYLKGKVALMSRSIFWCFIIKITKANLSFLENDAFYHITLQTSLGINIALIFPYLI